MTQLLQNLTSNAIKFCDKEYPIIHISTLDDPLFWIVSIKDNGIGIDKRYSDRIFTLFESLHDKKEYPGIGLGLAMCKKIVDMHSGEISFESKLGEGTTFYVKLPKE